MLRIHTKNMKLDENVDLELIAKDTHGCASSSASIFRKMAILCTQALPAACAVQILSTG